MIESVETLIVGAGPTGLFLASELTRRGRQCAIVERNTAAARHSKALALMPGTMELFERAGIEAPFRNAANRVDCVRFVTPRREALISFAQIRSRYNYVSILPQWKTQALLEQHLRHVGVRVRYAHRLLTFHEIASGVEAVVETPEGVQRMRARYLAGCDGIHSTVRETARIAFKGDAYPGVALLADAYVDTPIAANEARVHLFGGGVVTMFPMGEKVRRIVVIAPREVLPESASTQWLQQRLRDAGYAGCAVVRTQWSNTFRVHRRVAERMRRGRVLLAGDAVHTHSPVGGQGMNVGLHDASNLAEHLAQVLGGAPERLLDRYEAQRLPVARAVVRRTDVLTRALLHPNPILRATRERFGPRLAAFPAIHRPLVRALSLTA